MARAPKWADDQIEEMLNRMREGETLTSIASDPRMPSVQTMSVWEADRASERGLAITRAREIGWSARAEKAVVEAKTAKDAGLGRLSLDAERWFLGKMYPKKFGERTLLGSDPENPLPDGFKVTLVKADKPDA